MKHKAMPYLQAVDEVRKAQPTVHINPGFEAQLALYRDMGCRLPPGTRKHPKEGEEPPAAAGTSEALTAVENRGGGGDPTNVRADATYRWFLFACGVKNGDQGYLQRLPSLHSGGGGFCRAGSSIGGSGGGGGPGLMREDCGGPAAAAYRCRACRASLFSETNVVDHRHPVVQAASDSVYASFSRHGGDGSSWLVARDAAAAASASGSASSSSSSSTFGARAPASKTPRGGGKGAAAPSRKFRSGGGNEISDGRVSTVGLASPTGGGEERGCCTSVFTEVLGWVEISEVCRGGGAAGLGPRQKFGKILCPGKKGGRRGGAETSCQSKLGSWSLDGAACSCGRTVKPALQFTLSRIERVG